MTPEIDPNSELQARLRRRLVRGLIALDGGTVPYAEALARFKRYYVQAAVLRCKGSQSKAARALGIHRNTVNRLRGGK